MSTWNRPSALIASLAIATVLTACGGAKTDVAPAPADNSAAVVTPASAGRTPEAPLPLRSPLPAETSSSSTT